ncbi:translocase [Seohaeicola zhoushanensis]|uniref:Translocase n=1 Tax=Seohaeicola zhoushanensis TaxID=1569283 RepID=A0A8J3GTB6_9RHOB|nr:translocase [Seohaeicola zhoushanensis]GHF33625.1 hypothetical protein GCM10017056_01290 [Seohaeicola zhoushanensis]
MSRKRKLLTSAGTVGAALAIGWVMQTAVEPPKGAISLRPTPIAKTFLEPQLADPALAATQQAALPEPVLPDAPDMVELPLTQIRLTSVESPLPAISDLARALIASASFEPDVAPTIPEEPLTPYLGCEITATAEPAPLATVKLTVMAPCNGSQRVTIHHSGMMFTETTSRDGGLHLVVPAMSHKAVFIVQFDNGRGAVASADVAGLDGIDRVALQWTGDTGFQVHAREFGAAYGSDGHVWAGSVASHNGGSFQRLGDPGALGAKVVEVYTFPTEGAKRSGTVDLTIEAEITAANCGRDISAQSIELRQDAGLRTQDLVLSMPDCSAVGDFLVLNNLVDDLKIAAK